MTLAGDGRHLFVVNANSNTVSTFAIRRHEIRLVSVVDSGGLRPVSVAECDGLVQGLSRLWGGSRRGGPRRWARRGAQPGLAARASGATRPGVLGYPGSSSVSSFSIAKGGRLELVQAAAAITGTGTGASDMAVSHDGRRLFVLSGGNQRVNAYGIRADGGLDALGSAGGFLPGAVGMAAN